MNKKTGQVRIFKVHNGGRINTNANGTVWTKGSRYNPAELTFGKPRKDSPGDQMDWFDVMDSFYGGGGKLLKYAKPPQGPPGPR